MTKEQAIKEMKEWTGNFCEADGDWEFRPCIDCVHDCVTKDTLKVAIECIEKQIPKKPSRITFKPLLDTGWEFECPNCGLAVGVNKLTDYTYLDKWEPYCGQCGQAIDWSVGND